MKKPHEILTKAMSDKGITQKALSGKVFGDESSSSQVKMRNILTGVTERLSPAWVTALCKELSLTPNELFGWKK